LKQLKERKEMETKELEYQIEMHQDAVKELKTTMHKAEIASFLLEHPNIRGIKTQAVEVLLREQDVDVQREAIIRTAEEQKRRGNVHAPDFCMGRRSVSEHQARKILREIKTKNSDKTPVKSNKSSNTRSNVVSFRATPPEEDAIELLSNELCVSKSLLVDILIKVSNRYGIELK